MEKKNIKIFMIAGKSSHGKTTLAGFIREFYETRNLKVAKCQFSTYIKYYAKEYFGWDGSEETKPRELLQKLGTEIIRENIRDTFFIERVIDDINVLSYFFDIIIIDDLRLENEITMIKERFNDVITIHVQRINYLSKLTSIEQQHITETNLDHFNDYDYKIKNNTLEYLKTDIVNILEGIYEK